MKGGDPNLNVYDPYSYYIFVNLEFFLPQRYPQTLSSTDIDNIKEFIGEYILNNKELPGYFGTKDISETGNFNYHIFTTPGGKSGYFDLQRGGDPNIEEPTARVFVDLEFTLEDNNGFIRYPKNLTLDEIPDIKAKIRRTIKDTADGLIYKGLINGIHIFVNDLNAVHRYSLTN
jgi:hypothetical protein